MANRREFLQIGMTVTAWPLAAGTAGLPSSAKAGSGSVPFYKAVYDSRYQDSRDFAGQMQKHAISLQEISGDITTFWYQELDAIWRKEAVAIAGMTAHGPLFCLEQLAWPLGMKVVYKAEHRHNPGQLMEHRIRAPESMLAESKSGPLALGKMDRQWSKGVADLMQTCPTGHTAISEASLMAPLSQMSEDADNVDVLSDSLISWIIAPARKV